MANFPKIQITNRGIAEQLKAQSGIQLKFSKIKMGSGNFTGDVATLTNLVKTELSADIVSGDLVNSTYTVRSQFTNDGLQTGFYWREIGLFGVDENGNEYLYGYANCGNQADYIPAVTSSIYSKHVSIAVAVGSATNVTIEYTEETYIDIVTFNKFKSDITQSLSAIQEVLDDVATTGELDDVKTNLEGLINGISNRLESLGGNVQSIETKIGTDTIQTGDTTIIGAINRLYTMIQGIPAITSGTTQPSGGKDGDVYIRYE